VNPLALGLALAAASCLAIASVIQQHAAGSVADDLGSVRLFLRLLRTPRWLVGRAIDTAALGFQAFALAHGSLIGVQAAITTSVVLALALEAVVGHREVHPRELAGAAAVVLGVSVLLAVGRPTDHGHRAGLESWAAVFGIAALGIVLVARRERTRATRARGAFLLAIGTGVCFALDAAALKALGDGGGIARVALFAALFVLAASGGNLLVQRAFQLAPLNASLPVLTATTPVAGVVVGVLLFEEHFRAGLAVRSIAAAAVAVLATGALVASRAPALGQPAAGGGVTAGS
jgi:drug/metabolite transporter (DMT)-like permease